MKSTEEYFSVVVLTVESVDEILQCDHSIENYSDQNFPLSLYMKSLSVAIQISATEQH